LLKQFFRGVPHAAELRTQLLLGGLLAWEQSRLFSPAVRAACAGFDPHEDLPRVVDESGTSNPIDRLIYQHSKFYLADQNLVNVDRASMACGLEVRAPFLDHNLVDLACDRVARVGLFDPTVVKRLVAEHVAGHRDHRKILWALLMLDAWRESYLPTARWT